MTEQQANSWFPQQTEPCHPQTGTATAVLPTTHTCHREPKHDTGKEHTLNQMPLVTDSWNTYR